MAVILHVAFGCMKACLSSVHLASYFVQFFQVLQFIRENGMKNLFEHDNQELTAANLIALLKPTYSPRGSAQHAAEEIVYSNLMHFVTAVEGEMKCFFLLRKYYGLPYYPAYNTHFYTPQHLCQGGGACYQRVHKQNFFTLMLWCGACVVANIYL